MCSFGHSAINRAKISEDQSIIFGYLSLKHIRSKNMGKIYSIVLCLAIIMSNIVLVNAENYNKSDGQIVLFDDSSSETAIAEAKTYLLGGITIRDDEMSNYVASNGVNVSIEWNKVYDNTIADEKGTYPNDTYLKSDGKVVRPKWYEGTKKLIGTALLTAGSLNETVENINVSINPTAKPDFDTSKLSDYIDIGNTESESTGFECVRDNGTETNVVDGITHTYRTLNKNGAMVLTMKCDPEKVNYLTIKLWGNDTGDTMLWVCDPETGNMNIANNSQPTRNSLVDRRDWVELNFLNSSPQYNGGFIYSTYMIPTVYTKGKEYVSLRLYSTGGNANYSSVTIKEQTMPSRGIYAAYMTQDSNFDPSAFETVTGKLAKTAETSVKSYEEQKQLAFNYAQSAVEIFKSWQIYGQNNYPSYMEGMVTRRTDWTNKSLADDDWKSKYYQSSNGMLKQNMTPLNIYEIFALAYKNAEKLGYGAEEKAELLDRIVKGIDFLVRAQGSNGGFYSSKGWIGGPERTEASGNNLTGFGLRSVASSVITVYDDIAENGYLEQIVDSDADGENDTVRQSAWESMMSAARDYLVSLDGAGHAPNQDMADIIAALRFEKALQIMNSPLSWKSQNKEDEIEKQLDMALGFRPNLACSSYWVSPKGLILENFGSIQGGYSGDYGIEALEEMSQLVEFAEDYYGENSNKAGKYTDLIKKAYECSDKFMFTANASDEAEPTLYAEGIISNRNAYYPGTERYILDYYTALSKKNKTALKTFDYFFKHNKLENESEYSSDNAHFEDNALSVLKLCLCFEDIVYAINEENINEYEYLMEDDSINEYAWADEMGRNVVIKNGEDKIYIALNWRNPLRSVNYYNTAEVSNQQKSVMNNLARVHHTTNIFDKYGYAAMETEDWNIQTADSSDWQLLENHYVEAFMYMKYGDYAVIMNSNNLMNNENDREYDIPSEKLGLSGLYKDLVSGSCYYFGDEVSGAADGNSVKVQSASTLVLYKLDNDFFEAKVKSAEYEEGTVTVNLSKSGGNEEIVCVYAAEYNNDNTLAGIKKETRTIKADTEIKFNYEKTNQDNIVRIFVWNEDMKPYEWER